MIHFRLFKHKSKQDALIQLSCFWECVPYSSPCFPSSIIKYLFPHHLFFSWPPLSFSWHPISLFPMPYCMAPPPSYSISDLLRIFPWHSYRHLSLFITWGLAFHRMSNPGYFVYRLLDIHEMNNAKKLLKLPKILLNK